MNATSTFLRSGTEGAIAFRRLFKPIDLVSLPMLPIEYTKEQWAQAYDRVVTSIFPDQGLVYKTRSPGVSTMIRDSYALELRGVAVDKSGRGGVLCGTR